MNILKDKKIIVCCLFAMILVVGIFAGLLNGIFVNNVYAASYNTRQIFDFNSGWTFCKGEGIENSGSSTKDAIGVSYIPNGCVPAVFSTNYVNGNNGEIWSSVCLPHTYNDTDTFDDYVEALSENNGLSYNGERSLYGGTAWYKKTFYVPSSYQNKQIYIEFEAARQSAQIWVNGVAIPGTYLNGSVAFGYDLTSHLVVNSYNTITVLVDNSYPYYVTVDNGGNFISMYDNGTTVDIVNDVFKDGEGNLYNNQTGNPIPWHDSHWHPNYGGLYRNCNLYVVNKLHLTLPLYSFLESEGTYVSQSFVNGIQKTANIYVKPQIENLTGSNQTFSYVVNIFDMDNVNISSTTVNDITLNAGAKQTYSKFIFGVGEGNPLKLWSPNYPYLYTVEVGIFQSGICIDNNVTKVGFRTLRATTDKGLFVNENYTFLNGWNQDSSSEWAGIGSATSDWMQEYEIKQMKQAGANYIRWGSPPSSAQISACDKYGLIVTMPGVDGEGDNAVSGDADDPLNYSEITLTIRTNTFRDMLIYYRNSPSIVFWEIGNQGTEGVTADSPMDVSLALMRSYINTYDTDGNRDGSTGAIVNVGTFDESSVATSRFTTIRRGNAISLAYCDVAETTEGGYILTDKPLLEAAYNRNEARRGVWDLSTAGFTDFSNDTVAGSEDLEFYTSEDYAVYQARAYNEMVLSHGLTLMGGANWTYSDTVAYGRLISEVARCSGEVDATFLEKESYDVCRVLYSTPIYSHIIGHWNYPAGTTKDVYVASKAHSVVLTVNHAGGTDTYTASVTNSFNNMFVFEDVVWKSGTISVVGYDSSSVQIATAGDSITTHGAISNIRITNNVTSPIGLKANGADCLILDIEAIDASGNRCCSYDGEVEGEYVYFSVTNENLTSTWCGGYNSGIYRTIKLKSLYFEGGITRILLCMTQTAGLIGVTATFDNHTANYQTISESVSDASNIQGTTFNYSNKLVCPDNPMTGLTEPAFNSIPAPTETQVSTSVSEFIQSLECYVGSSYYTVDEMAINKKIYLDLNTKFKSVPLRYTKTEYVQLNNSYYASTLSKTVSFVLTNTCTLVLFFPVSVTIPTWVTTMGFTKVGYNITTDVGIIYTSYEKQGVPGEIYNYGSMDPSNNYQTMFIMGFYDEIPSQSLQNFTEPCSVESSQNPVYVVATDTGTSVTQEDGTNSALNNLECLRFQDQSTGTARVTFPVGRQEGIVSFQFDMWMHKDHYTKFARFLFQQGSVYDVSGTYCAFRIYYNNQVSNNKKGDYMAAYARIGTDSSNGNTYVDTKFQPYTSSGSPLFPTHNWYTYKITVNFTDTTDPVSGLQSKKGKIEYLNTLTGTWNQPSTDSNIFNLNAKGNAKTWFDHIIICTGGTSSYDDFAVRNITFTSALPSVNMIDEVSIFDNVVTQFQDASTFYYLGPITSSNIFPTINDISVTLGPRAVDYSVVIDDYWKCFYIDILNSDGDTIRFTFSYYYASEFQRFSDWYLDYGHSLKTHEHRPLSIGILYQNYQVYNDKSWVFSSVPIDYAGAGYFLQKSTDYSSLIDFTPAEDCQLLALIHIHDILAGLNIPSGWTDTGEIVTTDSNYVYKVFKKPVLAGVRTVMNFATTNDNLSLPVIYGIKSDTYIEQEKYFFDDFSRYSNETGLPFGWDSYVGEECSITVNNEGVVEFIDESNSNEQAGFAYINGVFSNMDNIFDFDIELKVDSIGNTNNNGNVSVVNFIRFGLMDGKVISDLSLFADPLGKFNYAIELYLHEADTVSGTMEMLARTTNYSTNATIKRVFTNVPKDTWLHFTVHVNPQNHTYTVDGFYYDNGGNQVSLTRGTAPTTLYFLHSLNNPEDYFVSRVNTLVLGSAANFENHFYAREVEVTPIRKAIIQSIEINDQEITTYDELTRDYLYMLDSTNTLPDITVVSEVSRTVLGNPSSAVLDESGLYYLIDFDDSAIDESNSYFLIEITDTDDEVHRHRVYIYGNTTMLSALMEDTAHILDEEDQYSLSSWSAFNEAYGQAQEIFDTFNHNYNDITNAYNDLLNAYNNMVDVYDIILVYDITKGSVSYTVIGERLPGQLVTINITNFSGYAFDTMTVFDGTDYLQVINRQFYLTNHDVTVTITFKDVTISYFDFGQNYRQITSPKQSISITKNSSFTVEFLTQYIPSDYSQKVVELQCINGWQFPVGTKITMVNYTNPQTPTYYYYIVNIASTTINLTQFIPMAKISGNFELPSGYHEIIEDYVMVFNFENVSNLTSGAFQLLHTHSAGTAFARPLDVSFTVVNDATSFQTSFEIEPAYKKCEFAVNVIATSNENVNSQIKGRNYMVVVSNTDLSPFVSGSYFIYNGQGCQMSSDNKYAVIPISSLGMKTFNVNNFVIGYASGGFAFNVYLYASDYLGYWNGSAVLLKSTTLSMSGLIELPNPSLNISSTSRIINSSTPSITLFLDYNADVKNAQSVDIRIQRYSNGVYIDDSDGLYSVDIGTTPIIASNGVVPITSFLSNVDLVTQLGNQEINVNFGTLLSGKNIYRILITITLIDGTTKTVSYNIICT